MIPEEQSLQGRLKDHYNHETNRKTQGSNWTRGKISLIRQTAAKNSAPETTKGGPQAALCHN